MYSPKLRRELIPCLYWAAKERNMPMTRLVNLYVSRGLAMESLGEEAMSYLPTFVRDLQSDRHSLNQVLADVPFSSVEEMDQWYGNSVRGITRAFGTVFCELQTEGVNRKPSEMSIEWKYQTALFNLQDVYVDSLGFLTGSALRVSEEK